MKFKRMTAVCSVAAMLVISFGYNTAFATAQETEPEPAAAVETENAGTSENADKDEVVYAKMTPDGTVEAIYAVNRFNSAQGKTFTDYGEYKSVVNLTDVNPLVLDGDAVTFTSNEDNFYYQGNMLSTDLPWVFDITYSLDGIEMPPQDIAGKDGKLEMHITSKPNDTMNPIFYDNYMLQMTVTLDTDKCSNISAPDGTIANAGKDKTIAFTVLPENDANFKLTADVQDCSMTGMTIAAIPYAMNMEIPDMDDQLDDLEKLPEAISELNDGVTTLKDGTIDMKDGASQLTSGSASIKNGLATLSGNSATIRNGSASINTALSQIATALQGAKLDEIDISQLAKLPEGLTTLAGSLRDMSGGLTQLKEGFGAAYSSLDSAMAGIPEANVSEEMIQKLYAAVAASDPAQIPTVDALVQNYQAAQTVRGTYYAVKEAFDSVDTSLDATIGGLGTMADSLDSTATEISSSLESFSGLDDLKTLVSGISALSSQYATFNSGLASYTSGVDTLSSNYASFHSGLVSFSLGVDDLANGVGELSDGTNTLNDEVSDMPDMVQGEIDTLKEQYMPSDFDPVSFTSSKNTDTAFVQFIIQGESIEEPVAEESKTEPEPEKETFWSRFSALFKGE